MQSLQRRLTQKQEVVLHVNEFAFISEDIDRFMGKHNGLKTIRLKYFDLCEQRDYCLTHMGHEPGLDAYREFAVKTEETMTELQSNINQHSVLCQDDLDCSVPTVVTIFHVTKNFL